MSAQRDKQRVVHDGRIVPQYLTFKAERPQVPHHERQELLIAARERGVSFGLPASRKSILPSSYTKADFLYV